MVCFYRSCERRGIAGARPSNLVLNKASKVQEQVEEQLELHIRRATAGV